MEARGAGIIVDLVTDTSSNTVAQITAAVQDKLSSLAVLNHQQGQETKEKQREVSEQNSNNGKEQKNVHLSGQLHIHDGPHRVVLFSKAEMDQPPILSSTVIVSSDCVELLFKAKTCLDQSPGFGCDVQVVTSRVMKKFWEAACLHLFSPVTTWSVWGVAVEGQVREPVELAQVETSVRGYLRTVGDPGLVNVWRSDLIPRDKFNAGFHDRCGGVSQLGPLASMNMIYTPHKPDSVLVVEENRRRLAHAAGFDPATMYVTKAEHSTTIWVVGREQPVRYDGIVTDQPGVTVCAAGADCCMILLADTLTGAVGAVHAGWRGTVLMAVKALVHTMAKEFGTQPAHIRAIIGPSISAEHFLLSPDQAQPVTDLDPTLTWPSKDIPHMVHIDLVKANVLQLQREGVLEQHIDTTYALCTFENEQFFSCERDGKPFGNQVGFISCPPV